MIIFSGIILGLIGAKLFYVFVTYSYDEILELIVTGNSKTFFQSGFVFYGGLIFGIIGAFAGARIAKVRLYDYEKLLVPLVPLVHAFGRLGCLFAGCCYGKVADACFGVVYKNPISDAPQNVPLIPIQMYEAILNILLFLILRTVAEKTEKVRLLPIYLCSYSTIRFFTEFWRFDSVRGSFSGLSTSQWISIAIFATSVFMITERTERNKTAN